MSREVNAASRVVAGDVGGDGNVGAVIPSSRQF